MNNIFQLISYRSRLSFRWNHQTFIFPYILLKIYTIKYSSRKHAFVIYLQTNRNESMNICNNQQCSENRKFFKILQNSPKFNFHGIDSFFDYNREKYESYKFFLLSNLPIQSYNTIKSTTLSIFPINYPPFEPSFPFESLFLLCLHQARKCCGQRRDEED